MQRPLRVVDLFAGAGGFSTGAAAAGARVLWAGNHWQEAVSVHAANHAATEHVCQDLHQADWARVPRHDLLVASPACQGHARARGRERRAHDDSRATAWAVVACAEYHRPPFICIENVPEFADWLLFPAWRCALELLGYRLTMNRLNAADFGVPQSRERLFIVAARGGELALASPELAHVACTKIIDWKAGFLPIAGCRHGRPLGAATLARIERGREQHGERFYVAYYGSAQGGRSVALPLGTLTTRDRFMLVAGDGARLLSVDEARAAMGFPPSYRLPPQRKLAMHLLGNAVAPPVARSIVEQIAAAA